jgi:hypothetical protein
MTLPPYQEARSQVIHHIQDHRTPGLAHHLKLVLWTGDVLTRDLLLVLDLERQYVVGR